MKVNQIVSEHKKGVRAMKYGKKTKGAVPVYGPEAKDAKLKPVKPTGPMGEAVLKAFEPGKQAVISDPDKGTDITLDLTKPQNMAALKPNDQGQLEYDPTPDMSAPGAQPAENPLKPGAEIAIKADEGGDIGGDPTDQFIKDVTDTEFEKAQGREVDEAPDTPYFVDMTSNPPSVKTSATARVPIQVNSKLDNPTPDIVARAQSQGFNQVTLTANGKQFPAFLSGAKCFVGPTVMQQITASAPAVKENAELEAMLRIAGLR